MEYPSDEEMSSEQFHNAYYGATWEPIRDRQAQLHAIDQILTLMRFGYEACKPRDQLLKEMSTAKDKLAVAQR